MRSIQWSALALSAATFVHGYSDTSPFFMFSTSELLNSATKLSRGEAVTSELSSTLSLCPSDHYILISQPGVTAGDYSSRRNTPTLAQGLSTKGNPQIRSSVSVSEVIGEVDISQWEQALKRECGAEVLHVDAASGSIPSYKSMPKVLSITFPAPTQGNRIHDLSQNDAFLASVLDMLPSSNYTVLYTTSTNGASESTVEYVMDSEVQDSLHMEMKRELGSGLAKRASNQTLVDGPLFERYQFFTPGIFMGFLVGFILLMILYVGISALASLQVTYAAFDKEQGALAKTKAQ